MINPDTLTRERIQAWLDARHGGDRSWLAQSMGLSLGGVHHCFSKQGFSKKGRAAIARLMELDEGTVAVPGLSDQIELSQKQWERFEQAREYMGNPSRPVFIRECIIHHTDKVLEDKAWDNLGQGCPVPTPAPESLDRAAETPPHP